MSLADAFEFCFCPGEWAGVEVAGDGAADERVVGPERVPKPGDLVDGMPGLIPCQIDRGIGCQGWAGQESRRDRDDPLSRDRVGKALAGEPHGGQEMPLIESPSLAAEQATVLQVRKPRISLRHEHARQNAVEATAKIIGRCLDCFMQRVDSIA